MIDTTIRCGCAATSGCGCTDEATGYDQDTLVCDACREYMETADGDIVCGRVTAGWRECHACGGAIEWGSIVAGGYGVADSRYGRCLCGSWQEQDCGLSLGYHHKRHRQWLSSQDKPAGLNGESAQPVAFRGRGKGWGSGD